MKKELLAGMLSLLALSLVAADAAPKDDVIAAGKQLAGQPNYSWTVTVVVPDSSPFKPDPTEGKLEKDRVTYFTAGFDGNTTQIYLQGDKSAISNPDGGWQSAREVEGDDGPGRFMAFLVRAFKAPAAEVADLAGAVGELKKDGDVYSGDMTEAGAAAQFRFGKATDPKGWVKIWITDGHLVKYEFKLTGKVNFNDNDIDVDRDTTVEIKDVGTTQVEVPADARKKLDAVPAAVSAPNRGDAGSK